MAYVGYDSRLHAAAGRPERRSKRTKVAWGRIAVIAGSGLAWAGIIAAIRAIL